ncbi:LuxR C-terminal-related transcriptional regulator [Marinicrinis lubricantis]|uniref:LuxR C-terminal-related transcriptional regulator n=1 Tax=Marinicrinis lubricantis TaxID=2086470 RepID=A0ABW1IJR3_9BACL
MRNDTINGNQEWIQQVQGLFSKALGHPVIITDLHGSPLSDEAQHPSIVQMLKEHIDPKLISMNHPILFESNTGEKAAACKIPLTHRCICVGSIREEDPRLIEEIRWVSRALGAIFSSLDQEHIFVQLKHNIENLRSHPSNWSANLNLLFGLLEALHPHLEFLGLAERTSEEDFKIKVCMEGITAFQDQYFKLGQGYLGQTAITGIPGYWSPLEEDPRIRFFQEKGIVPKGLFCCPIEQENQGVQMILFGGSMQSSDMSILFKALCETIAGVIGIAFLNANMKKKVSQREYFLTALYEINQTMVSLQDEKQILYILVDTCLNLLHCSVAIVGLFPEEELDRDSRVQFVSRGMTSSQVDSFGTFFTQRMHSRHSLKEIAFSITPWGERMLEIPLNYRNIVKGVLYVQMSELGQVSREQLDFVQALSMMSATFIHILQQAKTRSKEDHLDVLRKALKYWNPEGYEKAVKAELVAVGYAKYLGLDEERIERIQAAFILSCYPLEHLQQGQLMKGEPVLTIVREAQSGLDSSLSMESKIFMMANCFVTHHGRIEQLEKHIPFEEEKSSFIQFIVKHIPQNNELLIGKALKPSGELDIGLDLKNITNREKEVLQLIMEGLSNRDIAAALFISEHTVKNHISNLFHKLGVTDRTQLMTKIIKSKKEPVMT